jgi:hypothetical protein
MRLYIKGYIKGRVTKESSYNLVLRYSSIITYFTVASCLCMQSCCSLSSELGSMIWYNVRRGALPSPRRGMMIGLAKSLALRE